MKDKNKNKCICQPGEARSGKAEYNGYNEGYGYPVNYFANEGRREEVELPKVKGSFWAPHN